MNQSHKSQNLVTPFHNPLLKFINQSNTTPLLLFLHPFNSTPQHKISHNQTTTAAETLISLALFNIKTSHVNKTKTRTSNITPDFKVFNGYCFINRIKPIKMEKSLPFPTTTTSFDPQSLLLFDSSKTP